MANPPTPVFLTWLAARLVTHYDESDNVDFVQRLRKEADRAKTLHANMAQNMETYRLVETDEIHMNGKHAYLLERRGRPGKLGSKLWLTDQQANDLARQLDAPVDYFND